MGSLFRSGPSCEPVEKRIETAEFLFRHALLDPGLLRNALAELDLGLKDHPGNHTLLRKKADLQVLTLERHWEQLNNALATGELHQSARKILDSIIALEPRCGRTYLSRAKLNFVVKRKEEAEADLEKALRYLPADQPEYQEAQELKEIFASENS